VYNVTMDEKLVSVCTISGLPEPPKMLVADCGAVCAALETQYVMLNVRTNSLQDLFPYGTDEFNPLVCRVAKVTTTSIMSRRSCCDRNTSSKKS